MMSDQGIIAEVGITKKSSWFVLQRIRESCQSKDFTNPFNSITEIDEAHLGGKEKNRHAKDNRLTGRKKKQL